MLTAQTGGPKFDPQNPHKKQGIEGWTGGPSVKSICCSYRKPKSPQPLVIPIPWTLIPSSDHYGSHTHHGARIYVQELIFLTQGLST